MKWKGNQFGRREYLKTVGVVSSALVTGTKTVAGKKPQYARTIVADVPQDNQIDTVEVDLHSDKGIHIKTSGGVNLSSGHGSETIIEVTNTHENGTYTPEQAEVEITTHSKSNEPPAKEGSGEVMNPESGVSTRDHTGRDAEADYEGGLSLHSKDPINLSVCATDHWLDWHRGDWDRRRYYWRTWNYQFSTWEFDDAGFLGGVSIVNDAFQTSAYGDYYNWNWNNDSQKTEAHHRCHIYGVSDGDLGFTTDHWHSGENAGLLSAAIGIHSDYTDGPGP